MSFDDRACDYVVYTKGQELPVVVRDQVYSTRLETLRFIRAAVPSVSHVKDNLFSFTLNGVVVPNDTDQWKVASEVLRDQVDKPYIRVDVFKAEAPDDILGMESSQPAASMVVSDASVKNELDEKKPLHTLRHPALPAAPVYGPGTSAAVKCDEKEPSIVGLNAAMSEHETSTLTIYVSYLSRYCPLLRYDTDITSLTLLSTIFEQCSQDINLWSWSKRHVGRQVGASDLDFSMGGVLLDSGQTCAEAGVGNGARIIATNKNNTKTRLL